MQAVEQRRLADEEAAVEQRDGELDVVLVEACAVVERARGWADAQADVPHLLADAANRFLHLAAQRLTLGEEEKVNVGVRETKHAGRIRPTPLLRSRSCWKRAGPRVERSVYRQLRCDRVP